MLGGTSCRVKGILVFWCGKEASRVGDGETSKVKVGGEGCRVCVGDA
jgi:hypothetical protein